MGYSVTTLDKLNTIRHDLVCANNYRATDLTVEQFDRLIKRGVERNKLEFTTDLNAAIALIDEIISDEQAKIIPPPSNAVLNRQGRA